MAGRGERQRGGVIGEDRRSERGRGMGGGREERGGEWGEGPPRLRKHRVIHRYRDGGGKRERKTESAARKKGSQIPTRDAAVNRLIDVLHVSSNHAKSILMTVYPATPPHPFTVPLRDETRRKCNVGTLKGQRARGTAGGGVAARRKKRANYAYCAD